ncbi:zona pellucida sperm-binding protein 4-like isoform X2 [Dunckerocampus dactyliophorus]|uniref:zona pellucida sperm-binding protein 4-like isoform X2 n=1 Tax=Dunckerocampus dactyliophorus TaxID=161453 RepID=UPI0024071676|nr:zona pellucida sperm-binding protein 4-like isoform X2 [Dunckerocampus dactyliophorus]
MKLICLLTLALLMGFLAGAQKFTNQQPDNPTKSKAPTGTHQLSCEVEARHKIQCGSASISSSDCRDINCCHDGHMCYYGKCVTLQCTKDGQMIVVVARESTQPNIDFESISFHANEPRCRPVDATSAFAIYQFPITACGTVIMEEDGVVIYENRMSSTYEVTTGLYGAITRDSQYQVLLQCKYAGFSTEAQVIEVGQVPQPNPAAAPGPLNVELRLGSGVCTTKGCVEEDLAFRSFYEDSDYPLLKVLRDPVYVEVRMPARTDPNLVLTLGRCWATANPSPHSVPQWDLLVDGCPWVDDSYQTTLVPVGPSSGLLYPTHHRRFIFKMFTFLSTVVNNSGKGGATDPEVRSPLTRKVYIHCDTSMCQRLFENNCEPTCFRKSITRPQDCS